MNDGAAGEIIPNKLAERVDNIISALEGEIRLVRRHLHRYPEISNEEVRTARFLRYALAQAKIRVRSGIGGNGLLADIGGEPRREGGAHDLMPPTPTVAWRCDIDALPLKDICGSSYQSRVSGVAHACGHDAHTAIGYGVARVLKELEPDLTGIGAARVIFQPAEEAVPGGAHRVIEAGGLDGVEAIFALHCDPTLDHGMIGVRLGAFTASSDRFTVTVKGRGGHAARPHLAVDANLAMVQVIQSIYLMVPTMVNPLRSAVLNVGKLRGGDAANVIAHQATAEGNLRTLDPEVREEIIRRIGEAAESAARANGCSATVEVAHGSPSIFNNDDLCRLTSQIVRETLGPETVHVIPEPSMGSEDFSHFSERVPGMMFRLGVRSHGKAAVHLHDGGFDLDERALQTGVRIGTRCMLAHLLRRAQPQAPALPPVDRRRRLS